MTWYFDGFDAAIGNPPFAGGDDGGVVMYERTQDGVTYIVCGNRRYEVTERGNLRYVGDVAPAPAPSWVHRLWAWVRTNGAGAARRGRRPPPPPGT